MEAIKDAFKRVQQLGWDMVDDDLISKQERLWFVAGEEREEGFKQFLDYRTYKPCALSPYKRWILCKESHPEPFDKLRTKPVEG